MGCYSQRVSINHEAAALNVSLGIVLLHGWLDEGATNKILEPVAHLFAEQGYIVLMPLMRGWGGGHNDCGLSQSADIARAVEWLASQPGVDPDRIGLVGFSFGGQVALLTGALSRRVKAIVSYDGPTDLAMWNAHLQWSDRLAKECRSDFKSRSPVTVASQIKAPVLLVEGAADTTVPPEQAQEMEQAILEIGWQRSAASRERRGTRSIHSGVVSYAEISGSKPRQTQLRPDTACAECIGAA